MKLTGEQIGVYIWGNGNWGPGTSDEKKAVAFLDEAIAVALAESSGVTTATNGEHVGLYQIAKTLHADIVKGRDLTDPNINIDCARILWNNAGGSFAQDWEKYENGAWKNHRGYGQKVYNLMTEAYTAKSSKTLSTILGVDAFKNLPLNLSPGKLDLGSSDVSTSDSLGDAFKKALNLGHDQSEVNKAVDKVLPGSPIEWFQGFAHGVLVWLADGFVTIGAFLAALTLIILGIVFLVSETKPGKDALKTGVEAALL